MPPLGLLASAPWHPLWRISFPPLHLLEVGFALELRTPCQGLLTTWPTLMSRLHPEKEVLKYRRWFYVICTKDCHVSRDSIAFNAILLSSFWTQFLPSPLSQETEVVAAPFNSGPSSTNGAAVIPISPQIPTPRTYPAVEGASEDLDLLNGPQTMHPALSCPIDLIHPNLIRIAIGRHLIN